MQIVRMFLCLFLMGFTVMPYVSAKEPVDPGVEHLVKDMNMDCPEWKQLAEKMEDRLQSLEPSAPADMQDPPGVKLPFPSEVLPIPDVLQLGTKIPFEVIVDKPDFQRPAYEKHWHSTTGRWSYMPTRVHYALHRLFTEYDIGLSNWYDFEHHIGFSIPMYQDEKALDLYIVAFQTEVTDVFTKGNQIIIRGIPKRKGVQVITITTGDVVPAQEKEMLLVQLATQEGDELDYSLISYAPPDFWFKQTQRH
jgi:hypothetical protein